MNNLYFYWQWLERYIDQILVIVLCLATIGDPIRLIINSFKEMMLRSTNCHIEQHVQEILNNNLYFLKHFALESVVVLQLGRGVWITVNLNCINATIQLSQYLTFKQSIKQIIAQHYAHADVFIEISANNSFKEENHARM